MSPTKTPFTVCAMCGSTRKKFPKSWTLNDCRAYCSGCWGTVVCSRCDHHDPKGKILRGRWTCRACQHKQEIGTGVDQETYHRSVIEDQNGECFQESNGCLDSAADSLRIPAEGTVSQSPEEEEDDSWIEAEECDDDIAPLPSMRREGPNIAVLREVSRPGHLVFLLDVSGSMRTVDVVQDAEKMKGAGDSEPAVCSRLDAAVSCAAKFVEQHARSHPRDVFSIATFADGAEVWSTMQDATTTKATLQELCARAANGTFYKAAISCATELLALRLGVPRHVVVLSDGRPADIKFALELFQAEFLNGPNKDVRVHGIGFGGSVESFVALQQLACLTSGAFALSGCSTRGLCDAFSSVSSTITASTLSDRSLQSGEPAQATTTRTLRPADFEQPDIGMFGKKGVFRFQATRTSFRYDGSEFHEQKWSPSAVARRVRPHMRGGMRLVYAFRDEVVAAGDTNWMVAKCSRFLDAVLNTPEVVEAHAKSSSIARHYAARFNYQLRDRGCKAAAMFFVPCFVYEATEPVGADEATVFAGERYLPGVFLKYNSNNGFVSESFMRHHDAVQAFTHFSFAASDGKLMVADLQGVARDTEVILTDPQVLSLEGSFGPGDLGARGMRACLAAHRCGPACRALGLKPVDAATLRRLGPVRTIGRRSHIASSQSAAWEKVSEPGAGGSDWDRVSERDLVEFAMSEGIRSSQASSSSWTHLLDT